jgi:hypothetical protein
MITEMLVEFVSRPGQILQHFLEGKHQLFRFPNQLSKIVNLGPNFSRDDFLTKEIFTPARPLKCCLYLLMISVVVGLGHF